eukprot:973918-Pleurochrysis_carterae.AAC.2
MAFFLRLELRTAVTRAMANLQVQPLAGNALLYWLQPALGRVHDIDISTAARYIGCHLAVHKPAFCAGGPCDPGLRTSLILVPKAKLSPTPYTSARCLKFAVSPLNFEDKIYCHLPVFCALPSKVSALTIRNVIYR